MSNWVGFPIKIRKALEEAMRKRRPYQNNSMNSTNDRRVLMTGVRLHRIFFKIDDVKKEQVMT